MEVACRREAPQRNHLQKANEEAVKHSSPSSSRYSSRYHNCESVRRTEALTFPALGRRQPVFFVDGDAALLPDMFASGEVDRLYINFCDPWPKSNQKKRRLTHGNFLKQYRRVLADGGQIHFKTDNDKLFAWSVEEIPQFGFQLSEVTTDLHKDGAVGVMTDYERKFFNEGKNINRCVATMVPWEEPAEPEAPAVAAEPAE